MDSIIKAKVMAMRIIIDRLAEMLGNSCLGIFILGMSIPGKADIR